MKTEEIEGVELIERCSNPEHYSNLLIWGRCQTCGKVWALNEI